MANVLLTMNTLQSALTSHISISFGTLGLLTLVDKFGNIPGNYKKYINMCVVLYAISFSLIGIVDYYDSYHRLIKKDSKFSTWDKLLVFIYMFLGLVMLSVIFILSIYIIKSS